MSKVKKSVEKDNRNALIGSSLVVFSSFFYASYGIWTKLMGDFFGGYTASAYRSVLVLVMLLPIAIFLRRLEPLDWKRNGRYLIIMTIASFFVSRPLYFAILHAGVGISLAVNYASIVIGMFFFGWLLANEQFTKDKWLSSFVGLIGLGLVFLHDSTQTVSLAIFAALLSGFCIALGVVMTKKFSYNATQSTIALWATSILANFIVAFLIQEAVPAIGWHVEWLYLLAFAIASIIASWSMIAGVKHIDAGTAGILGLLEIVFGVIFGVILFHEQLEGSVALGIVMIMIAAIIPYLGSLRLHRKPSDKLI